MSSSTRAPDDSGGDSFVERLGDRLGTDQAVQAPPAVRPVAPKARGAAPSAPPRMERPMPAAVESSDIRSLEADAAGDEVGDAPPDPPHHHQDFSEFDGDLESEATQVEEEEALAHESTAILQATPDWPLLVVEAGKDLGREYVLQEGETGVGRGIDNDVILADVSVSRRHIRVIREGERLTMRDLGSGNGTRVNGHRVATVQLADGDRIEIGETVLVVRIPNAVLEAQDAGPLALDDDAHTDETNIPSSPASLAPPPSGSNPTWDRPLHAAHSDLPPPPERTGSTTVVLSRRTVLALAATVAIACSMVGALVMALVLRDPEPTASALPVQTPVVTVPSMPPATATAAPPTGVPAPLPPRPPAGVVSPPPGIQTGVPAVAGQGAVRAGMPAPGAVVPEPAATTPVVAEAEPPAAPASPAETEAEEEPAPRAGRAGRARPAPVARAARPRPAPTTPTTGRESVLGPYRRGDFDAAARAARAASQESLARQIEQFAGHYRTIQRGVRGSLAVMPLERAIALDPQIVGSPRGHYAATLRPQLVTSYLDVAGSSMASRPQDACRRVQQALRLDDGNARARGMARDCDSRAAALVTQAEGVERSDAARARSLYSSALVMVAQGSPTYARARRRLDAMARARSVDEDE